MDAARLRLVDFAADVPAQLGAETRTGRAAWKSLRETRVLDPSGLEWRVRILRLPHAMTPHPPSELLAHADPAHGWTPLPLGYLLAAFALPFLPVVYLLRALRLLPWELEARTYPWGRRQPPVVLSYVVRGVRKQSQLCRSWQRRSRAGAAAPC